MVKRRREEETEEYKNEICCYANDRENTESIFSSQDSRCTDSNTSFTTDLCIMKDSNNSIKRIQHQKITTEIHQTTVSMMMEASKELWKHHHQYQQVALIDEASYNNDNDNNNNSNNMEPPIPKEYQHHQRPYW
ncbi:hypothetical protein C6P40_000384 [Pichia californica]|uniref:Uncharacterized protein n=1 Tax=Pichia californica TaxID=460514 RepID=A0A9P6WKS6_9ASCO|nr:hypothetical protein C6P40_000384 [[Candida] californica]